MWFFTTYPTHPKLFLCPFLLCSEPFLDCITQAPLPCSFCGFGLRKSPSEDQRRREGWDHGISSLLLPCFGLRLWQGLCRCLWLPLGNSQLSCHQGQQWPLHVLSSSNPFTKPTPLWVVPLPKSLFIWITWVRFYFLTGSDWNRYLSAITSCDFNTCGPNRRTHSLLKQHPEKNALQVTELWLAIHVGFVPLYI